MCIKQLRGESQFHAPPPQFARRRLRFRLAVDRVGMRGSDNGALRLLQAFGNERQRHVRAQPAPQGGQHRLRKVIHRPHHNDKARSRTPLVINTVTASGSGSAFSVPSTDQPSTCGIMAAAMALTPFLNNAATVLVMAPIGARAACAGLGIT